MSTNGPKRTKNAAAQRSHKEHELEAEQESAEAMDAEVQDAPAVDETTEGQPT